MSSASASLPSAAPIDAPGPAADTADTKPAIATGGLRRAHLWAVIPIAIAWFAASIDVIEPFDFWWNVKSGQIMFQTGRFLSSDVLVWSPVPVRIQGAVD